MSHRTHSNIPETIYVICADGHCRHPEPFTDDTAAEHWANSGHACLRRHWWNDGTFDNSEVSRIVSILERDGLDRPAAEALDPDQVAALMGIEPEAWGRTENGHWCAALDRLAWHADENDR